MARSKKTLVNIDNSDLVNYPEGRIKNNTGVGDGTPVNEFVYGEIHEFFAKCMRLYGIVFNGVPDNETNGYQFVDAVRALASKNDYLLTVASSSATTLTIPLKLSLVKTGESFICVAASNRAAETLLAGTLDALPSTFAVTFKGGSFKTGDYLIVVKTVAGVDIIRLVDGTNLDVISSFYNYLKAASLVEERAGAIDTKATTPLTNFTIFVERVNGNPQSDPFKATQSHNGLMSKEDKLKLDNIGGSADRYGTILVGDVAVGAIGTFLPVTGDIQSAQITTSTGPGRIITVTLDPPMLNSDYTVHQFIESLGSMTVDDNIQQQIFKKISSSQFQILPEETGAGAQNIKYHIDVKQR